MKIRGREREHEQLFRVLEDKLIKSRIEHPEITAYDRVNTPYIQDLSKLEKRKEAEAYALRVKLNDYRKNKQYMRGGWICLSQNQEKMNGSNII